MVGYSEVYDQQYWDLCVRRLYLCGWVYGKGCTTYTEICDGFWDFAEDSQSSYLSWSVLYLIHRVYWFSHGFHVGNLFLGIFFGDFPVQRFGPLSHVFMSMIFLKWWILGEIITLIASNLFKSDFVLMYAGIILIRSVFCWPALNMNNLMEILGGLLLSILTHPVQI